jgi:hypothetical protein
MTHIVRNRAHHPANCRHHLCIRQLTLRAPVRFIAQIQTKALIKHEDIAAI